MCVWSTCTAPGYGQRWHASWRLRVLGLLGLYPAARKPAPLVAGAGPQRAVLLDHLPADLDVGDADQLERLVPGRAALAAGGRFRRWAGCSFKSAWRCWKTRPGRRLPISLYFLTLILALANTPNVMHPPAPILNSDAWRIQLFFSGLLLLTLLAAAQFARWLFQFERAGK